MVAWMQKSLWDEVYPINVLTDAADFKSTDKTK